MKLYTAESVSLSKKRVMDSVTERKDFKKIASKAVCFSYLKTTMMKRKM